jgi:hypothetical protein
VTPFQAKAMELLERRRLAKAENRQSDAKDAEDALALLIRRQFTEEKTFTRGVGSAHSAGSGLPRRRTGDV